MKKRIGIMLAFLMLVSAAFSPMYPFQAADSKDQVLAAQKDDLMGGPAIGEKLEDFTVNLVDGSQIKYSDILKDHKVVLINCFASWCSYCIQEFPVMEEAYKDVSQDVAIIALSTEPSDTLETLAPIKKENGLTFYMGIEPTGIFNEMNKSGYPASLLVDRFGVVCWKELGAILDGSRFDRLFKDFLADDYSQSLTDYEIPEDQGEQGETKAQPEEKDDAYKLSFTDQDGNPVAGVMVSLCADNCQMMESDARGQIIVDPADTSYEVHVLKAPEGYKVKGEDSTTLNQDQKTFSFVLEKTS